jgi:hypothetical protein
MKKYITHISVLVSLIIISILALSYYYRPAEQIEFIEGGDIRKAETIDSLQNLVDSLNSEILSSQIEIGRYRVALDIFMDRNPKSAKQYEAILSQETE